MLDICEMDTMLGMGERKEWHYENKLFVPKGFERVTNMYPNCTLFFQKSFKYQVNTRLKDI